MPERISGKWAAEIYDLLRIFSRLNNSVYGLLLLEIGWVFLLILISKLSPSGGDSPEPAILTIPFIGVGGSILETRVLDLVVPGSLVILLLWGWRTNLFIYISWPIIYIFKLIVIAILFIVLIIVVLVNLLLFPFFWPIEYLLVRRWLRNLKPEVFQKLAEEYGEQQAKKTLYEMALKEISFNALILAKKFSPPLTDIMRNIISQSRIGLAPLQSYNYEEDLNAAKAPSQVFSIAITRTKWQLEYLKSFQYVQFVHLPQHLTPKNSTQARRIRRFLGLDALVWGSYLTEDYNKIWINIDCPLPKNKVNKRKNGKVFISNIFPWVLDIEPRMLVIDQRNSWDAYVTLILATIRTFKARRRPNSPITKFFDNLYYGELDVDKLIEHLIFDAFQEIPNTVSDINGDIYPVPTQNLADIAGKWVARQLRPELRYEGKNESADSLVNRLLPIQIRCVTLAPDIVENYYRLGTLYCLAGEVDKSLETFGQARQYEVIRNYSLPFYVRANAKMALAELDKSTFSDVPLARYVAYVARAINIGGQETKGILLSEFKNSMFFKVREFREKSKELEVEEAPSLDVFFQLVSEEYNADEVGKESNQKTTGSSWFAKIFK